MHPHGHVVLQITTYRRRRSPPSLGRCLPPPSRSKWYESNRRRPQVTHSRTREASDLQPLQASPQKKPHKDRIAEANRSKNAGDDPS